MKKLITKWNVQNIVVTMCFFWVCLCSWQMQIAKWDSGLNELGRDMAGVVMAIVIMTNYKRADFVKYPMPYLAWTVLGIIGMAIGVPKVIAVRQDYLVADTVIVALGIFLAGYCVIRTIIAFFVGKYRPAFYKPLFVLWLVMMLWMVFSKTEYWWPECYLVLFLCYYLTEQTAEQRKNTIGGMVNGMILGFLFVQGHSFLVRPYDIARYYGNFSNPNHNCMFLCMCMVAIMGKILMGVREKRNKLLQVIYYFMLGVCLSFIFMTGCRSGYLATFVAVIFFLIGYCCIKGKMLFFRMGILLVSLFIAVMPVTYLAVRYLPTIHPYVLFYYYDEYSEERVHSWDPRDSEKFVSFEEMLESVLGRFGAFFSSFDLFETEKSEVTCIEKYNDLYVVSSGEFLPSILLTTGAKDFSNETDPDKIPALDVPESANAFLTRYTIYKWYYDHLSLRGMPYDEQGFQLTADHWIQDTHNIYLDYGINFGWPVMVMFAVFIWWGIGRLTKRAFRMRDVEIWACLLVCLIPPIFGLFEFSWGAGMISTVAFYFSFKEIFNGQVSNEAIEER